MINLDNNLILKSENVEYDNDTLKNELDTLNSTISNIVQSGSNSNGNWIKFSDGTIIEYGYGDCFLDANSYRDITFTLPVKTASTIWASITMQSSSISQTMGSITFAVNTFNTTSLTIRAFNNTSSGRGPSGYWMIIGKWK